MPDPPTTHGHSVFCHNYRMDTMHELLELALRKRASDLIVKAGSPPIFRIDGAIRPADYPALDRRQAQSVIHGIEVAARRDRLFDPHSILTEEEIVEMALGDGEIDEELPFGERDYVFSVPGLARVRANVYRQAGTPAAALRIIPLLPPTLEEIEMPPALAGLALQSGGLILVTGPTGSGKSTTLAAMIEEINRGCHRNILTIEDPVEFLFEDKKSVIQQREVGRDTASFPLAIQAALRQTPDVLMVGEMRTVESMEAVLMAAEVGHLVLSTLHTTSAPAAVDRLLNSFTPERRPQIVQQLTTTLTGIIAQRLIRRSDREGRVAVVELMTSSPTVVKMIEEGNTGDLISAMRDGSHYGMTTLNQSLERLHREGIISPEEALRTSTNPQELRKMLRHG